MVLRHSMCIMHSSCIHLGEHTVVGLHLDPVDGECLGCSIMDWIGRIVERCKGWIRCSLFMIMVDMTFATRVITSCL